VRFFVGRIALDISPGAEVGRIEAAALLAARGDTSSGSSCMLANLGIDFLVISLAGTSSFGICSPVGFLFGAFRCATRVVGAGFLTVVADASPLTSATLAIESALVAEIGFGKIGGRLGAEEDKLLLGLRGFVKGNSRFGGIHIC
jgi:hypothetical protein